MQYPAVVISGNPTINGSINTHVYLSCNQKSQINGDQCTKRKETPDYLHVKKANDAAFRDHRGDETIYQIKSELLKGRALLVSNEFKDLKDLARVGSEYDRHDMEALWKHMGCKVTPKPNLTVDELEEAVDEFVRPEIYSPANMYVVMIMSHGGKGDLILGSKRCGVFADKIIRKIINSKYLKGKPKLIFFQMCRGDGIDKTDAVASIDDDKSWIADRLRVLDAEETIEADYEDDGCMWKTPDVPDKADVHGSRADQPDTVEYADDDESGRDNRLRIPSTEGQEFDAGRAAKDYVSERPDVLLAFASQPGHLAYRSPTGSWLMQSIKTKFAEHASTHDVEKLMSMIKEDVGRRRANAPDEDYDGAKEEVDYRCTFGKKKLFLFPGFPKEMEE